MLTKLSVELVKFILGKTFGNKIDDLLKDDLADIIYKVIDAAENEYVKFYNNVKKSDNFLSYEDNIKKIVEWIVKENILDTNSFPFGFIQIEDQDQIDFVINTIRKLVRDNRDLDQYVANTTIQEIFKKLNMEIFGNKPTPEFIISTMTDVTPTNTFVGRKTELQKLRKYIEDEKKLVLVSGMGGIGKTHLCRYLYKEYVDRNANGEDMNIEHIGYLTYEGNMDDTVRMGVKYDETGNSEQDTKTAWKTLENLSQKRTVLFIDNVPDSANQDESFKELYKLTCPIILTSRSSNFNNFEELDISVMDIDDCVEIFTKIKKNVEDSELAILKDLIETKVKCHTLTVELLAHMSESRDWSISDLKENLDSKNFNIVYQKGGEKQNLQKEYEKLFNMSALSDSEKNILEVFSIFPYIPLDIKLCNQWLNDDANATEEDTLFFDLSKKGWLEKTENKGYMMHPVIAETIKKMRKPSLDNHMNLVKNCADSLYLNPTDIFIEKLPYIQCAEAIADSFYCMDENLGRLCNQIGVIYHWQCDYPKALEWLHKALDIKEKVLGTEYSSTATTYNNIAAAYDNQGDYLKALEWYHKALDIKEKVLGTEHPDTATTYNNIAGVYAEQGKYPKALEWYHKALNIFEKKLGTEHPDTATTYNNIAATYANQGDYLKALEWYHKDLAISEKKLGTEHPDTAITYNNIAGVYTNQGEYPEALEWYHKALNIFEKKLGTEHPHTKSVCRSIEIINSLL